MGLRIINGAKQLAGRKNYINFVIIEFAMSELEQIVSSLESKIGKLLIKMENLEQDNDKLKSDLGTATAVQTEALSEIKHWQQKYDSLKLANSMTGSNVNKTEAKLKINNMIRELDHCIAQLAE